MHIIGASAARTPWVIVKVIWSLVNEARCNAFPDDRALRRGLFYPGRAKKSFFPRHLVLDEKFAQAGVNDETPGAGNL